MDRPEIRSGLSDIVEKCSLVKVLMTVDVPPDVERVPLILGPLCKERSCKCRIEYLGHH